MVRKGAVLYLFWILLLILPTIAFTPFHLVNLAFAVVNDCTFRPGEVHSPDYHRKVKYFFFTHTVLSFLPVPALLIRLLIKESSKVPILQVYLQVSCTTSKFKDITAVLMDVALILAALYLSQRATGSYSGRNRPIRYSTSTYTVIKSMYLLLLFLTMIAIHKSVFSVWFFIIFCWRVYTFSNRPSPLDERGTNTENSENQPSVFDFYYLLFAFLLNMVTFTARRVLDLLEIGLNSSNLNIFGKLLKLILSDSRFIGSGFFLLLVCCLFLENIIRNDIELSEESRKSADVSMSIAIESLVKEICDSGLRLSKIIFWSLLFTDFFVVGETVYSVSVLFAAYVVMLLRMNCDRAAIRPSCAKFPPHILFFIFIVAIQHFSFRRFASIIRPSHESTSAQVIKWMNDVYYLFFGDAILLKENPMESATHDLTYIFFLRILQLCSYIVSCTNFHRVLAKEHSQREIAEKKRPLSAVLVVFIYLITYFCASFAGGANLFGHLFLLQHFLTSLFLFDQADFVVESESAHSVKSRIKTFCGWMRTQDHVFLNFLGCTSAAYLALRSYIFVLLRYLVSHGQYELAARCKQSVEVLFITRLEYLYESNPWYSQWPSFVLAVLLVVQIAYYTDKIAPYHSLQRSLRKKLESAQNLWYIALNTGMLVCFMQKPVSLLSCLYWILFSIGVSRDRTGRESVCHCDRGIISFRSWLIAVALTGPCVFLLNHVVMEYVLLRYAIPDQVLSKIGFSPSSLMVRSGGSVLLCKFLPAIYVNVVSIFYLKRIEHIDSAIGSNESAGEQESTAEHTGKYEDESAFEQLVGKILKAQSVFGGIISIVLGSKVTIFALVLYSILASRSVLSGLYGVSLIVFENTQILRICSFVQVLLRLLLKTLNVSENSQLTQKFARIFSLSAQVPRLMLVYQNRDTLSMRLLQSSDIHDQKVNGLFFGIRLLHEDPSENYSAVAEWFTSLFSHILIFIASNLYIRQRKAPTSSYEWPSFESKIKPALSRGWLLLVQLCDYWNASLRARMIGGQAWMLLVTLMYRRELLGLWYLILWVGINMHDSIGISPLHGPTWCTATHVSRILLLLQCLSTTSIILLQCIVCDFHKNIERTIFSIFHDKQWIVHYGLGNSSCTLCQWESYLWMKSANTKSLGVILLTHILVAKVLNNRELLTEPVAEFSPVQRLSERWSEVKRLVRTSSSLSNSLERFRKIIFSSSNTKVNEYVIKIGRLATSGNLFFGLLVNVFLVKRVTVLMLIRMGCIIFLLDTSFFRRVLLIRSLYYWNMVFHICLRVITLSPPVYLHFKKGSNHQSAIGRAVGVYFDGISFQHSAGKLHDHEIDNDFYNFDLKPWIWYVLILSHILFEKLVYSSTEFQYVLEDEFKKSCKRKFLAQELRSRIERKELVTHRMLRKERRLGQKILHCLKEHLHNITGNSSCEDSEHGYSELSHSDSGKTENITPQLQALADVESDTSKVQKPSEQFGTLKSFFKQTLFSLIKKLQGLKADSFLLPRHTQKPLVKERQGDQSSESKKALFFPSVFRTAGKYFESVSIHRRAILDHKYIQALETQVPTSALLVVFAWELIAYLLIHTEVIVAILSLFYFVSTPSVSSMLMCTSILCYALCCYPFAGILFWRSIQLFSFIILITKIIYYILGKNNFWKIISSNRVSHSSTSASSHFYKFYIPYYEAIQSSSAFLSFMLNYSFFIGNTYSMWDILMFFMISVHIFITSRYCGCYEQIASMDISEEPFGENAPNQHSEDPNPTTWRMALGKLLDVKAHDLQEGVQHCCEKISPFSVKNPEHLLNRAYRATVEKCKTMCSVLKTHSFIQALGLRKGSNLFRGSQYSTEARGPSGIVRDYYTFYFILDFLSFVLFVPSYYRLCGKNRGNLLNSVNDNLLPGTLVVSSLIAVLVFILDRLLYLKKSYLGKFFLQLTLSLIYMSSYFYWHTHQISGPSTFPSLAGGMIVLKGLYLVFSGLQIRYFEFPYTRKRTSISEEHTVVDDSSPSFYSDEGKGKRSFVLPFIGEFFDRSQYRKDCLTYKHGTFTYFCYMAFRSIPFFFELKNYLDWACTSTSLRIYQWYRLEDIYHAVYIRKVEITEIKRFLGIRKDKYRLPLAKKLLSGGLIFIFLLVALFFPLFYYSTFNPNLSENHIVGAKLSMRFGETSFSDEIFSSFVRSDSENLSRDRRFSLASLSEPLLFGARAVNATRSVHTRDHSHAIERVSSEDITGLLDTHQLLYDNYYDINYEALKSSQVINFPPCSATPWKLSPVGFESLLHKLNKGILGNLTMNVNMERKYRGTKENNDAYSDPGEEYNEGEQPMIGKKLGYFRTYEVHPAEQRKLSVALSEWKKCIDAQGMLQRNLPAEERMNACEIYLKMNMRLVNYYTPFVLNTPTRLCPLPESDDYRHSQELQLPSDNTGWSIFQEHQSSFSHDTPQCWNVEEVMTGCVASLRVATDPLTSSFVSIYWCFACRDILGKVRYNRDAHVRESNSEKSADGSAFLSSLYFIVFSDKIPTSIQYLTHNSSIIALYTTFIIVIGRLLRSITTGSNYQLVIAELSNTKVVDDIMSCIYLARKNREFKLEYELYNELMDLLRDPGRLFDQTGRLNATLE